jgi:hypothetical protein
VNLVKKENLMSDKNLEFMKALMSAGLDAKQQKEQERKAKQDNIVKDILKLSKEQNVDVLYVLMDMGEYTHQWINLSEEDKRNNTFYHLHFRGILEIVKTKIAGADTYPPSVGLSFNEALLTCLGTYQAFPLCVLARYSGADKLAFIHINVPQTVLDFKLAELGIKHLVQEFMTKE